MAIAGAARARPRAVAVRRQVHLRLQCVARDHLLRGARGALHGACWAVAARFARGHGRDGPSAPAGFETPTSWDATEPRLEEEVYLADNIDPAVSPEGLLYFGALPAGAHD